MRSDRFVAYYRVSTSRQGRSGLGLEAQRQAVHAYLGERSQSLVESFTEVESGTKDDRPQLIRALAVCRVHRAKLVIAKLDRLARNVAFVSNLLESVVEFEACDFPHANRLTIHILAAVAEHEARMASDRTKAALAAAKARGASLGGFRGRVATDADREKGRAARTHNANAFADDLATVLQDMTSDGPLRPSAVSRGLNERGLLTPRGMQWTAVQAQRLISRLEMQATS